MKKNIFTLLFLFIAIICSAQNKLTIVVDGMEEIKGSLLIGIYNSDSTFLKKVCHGSKVKVTCETEEVVVELPNGEYAISLFQDLNNNSSLDKGPFGIPTEKYGFSNNQEGFMGAPNFDKAKFKLEEDMVVRIKVK